MIWGGGLRVVGVGTSVMLKHNLRDWYKQAEGGAQSALEKSKILARLTEISKARYPKPDQQIGRGDALPTGLWIDVLRHVRLGRDRMTGEWVRTGQALVVADNPDEGSSHPRVALPVMIDGEYDLEVGFVRTKGKSEVNILFPVGSTNAAMMFSAPMSGVGTLSGLSNVDGKNVRENPTGHPSMLENGKPYVVMIRVRLQDDVANIEVLVGGRPFLQWSGKQTSLSFRLAPGGGRPGLSAYRSSVIFSGARIRLVSGEARLAGLKRGGPWGATVPAVPVQ